MNWDEIEREYDERMSVKHKDGIIVIVEAFKSLLMVYQLMILLILKVSQEHFRDDI